MWRKLRWPVLLLTAALPMLADPVKRPAGSGDWTEEEPAVIRAVPTPDDAVRLAYRDVLTLPPDCRCDVRYIYLPMGHLDGRVKRAASLIINYIHRASTTVLPVRLRDGYLVRIDLGALAPQHNDYVEFRRFWEELAFDPSFARLVTKDQIDAAGHIPVVDTEPEYRIEWKTVKHPGGKLIVPDDCGWSPGEFAPGEYRVRHYYLVKPLATGPYKPAGKKVVVIRENSHAIDPIALNALQEETHSLAPVVSVGYLGHRALRTIKEAADSGIQGVNTDLYKTIFGGLYYDFVGIRTSDNPAVTDLDLFFQDVGVGAVGEKVNGKQRGAIKAEDVFNRLRSDQGAITLISDITDKPRDSVFLETPSGDGSITGDTFDESIDIGDRVFRNYLNQRVHAREGIFWKRGIPGHRLHLFVLVDGNGRRTNVVPANVANDRRAPKPSTQQLQPGLSCIGCHSIEGKDGYQPIRNDVHLLTLNTDVFGDLKRARLSQSLRRVKIIDHRGRRFVLDADTVDRIAGKYKGDFTDRIQINRDWLAKATLRAVYGNWEEDDAGKWIPVKDRADPTNADVCRVAAHQLEETVGYWWWRKMDTQAALLDLGLDVPKSQALTTWKALVPPDPRNAVVDEYGAVVLIQEDPVVAGLAAGASFKRSDWALSRDRIAERVVRNPLYTQLRKGAAR